MDTDSPEFERLLEKAAEAGAKRALADVGLSDSDAVHDVYELRDLLDSWRSVKTTVGQTVTRFLTVAILSVIAALIGLNILNIE
jgi:hypothetical protein